MAPLPGRSVTDHPTAAGREAAPRRSSSSAWAAATAALTPGYVGGWTALSHWDMIDEPFTSTLFITCRPVARRKWKVADLEFAVRRRPERTLFGTRAVWRTGTRVAISEPERTLLDCLDDPSRAGGLGYTVGALTRYADRVDVRWDRLIEYADRLGNQAVFQRLGYVADRFGLAGQEVVDACLTRVAVAEGRLDPDLAAVGTISRRWRLRVNAQT